MLDRYSLLWIDQSGSLCQVRLAVSGDLEHPHTLLRSSEVGIFSTSGSVINH